MANAKTWYRNIPPITRFWCTTVFFLTFSVALELVNIESVYLSPKLIFEDFQVSRLLLAPFCYPVFYYQFITVFHFIFTLHLIYSFSKKLEYGFFAATPSDYVYMLMFTLMSCSTVALTLKLPFFVDMTMFVLITFWCLQHSNDRVEFWLGLEFKATRFPWYVLLYTFLLKWRVLEGLGIFIAMFFYHFKYVKPKTFFGINLLGTPNILCWLFPDNPDGVVSGPQYLWGHGLKIDD